MDEIKPRFYNDVVIIGAGLSGINLACQLQRKLGVSDYVIYDRAQELGGAWAANKYPGCGVDIPGALYSLSWFPNPAFTKIFPSQPEILAYAHSVAQSHNVPRHIVFQREWTGAIWNEKSSTWLVNLRDIVTGDEYIHEAKMLVSAVGGYTNPKLPSIPGLDSFQGPVVHTARWDKDYDLRGLNVAVIGNGCSASQVVPAIVDNVKSLIQFVRSPQHYVPMPYNFELGWIFRTLFSYIPAVLIFIRWTIFFFLETGLLQFYNNKKGQQMREQSAVASSNYIKKTAPKKYWPMLIPEYSLGCRRRILDCQYLKALQDPKVHLTRDSIVSVGEKSVITASGAQHDVDFLILATGFQFSQWQGDKIIGRRGVSLQQHWQEMGGIEAYKTIAVNGCPNFFYILGPNSGSGHTSVLFASECTANLVVKLARPLLLRKAAAVEVAKNAEIRYCDSVQIALRKTVLTDSCSSTGWNFFNYPFSSLSMWFGTHFPDMNHWIYR
ncbi:unnamed protein product [Clonostachys chloroleuca]|uniref:L-ornithine N(5)-monooxygenase [NAD(P)H] n=1 Tax=Clonostachys chloroleuca TaxID=1926264 RepID=A0AA35PSP9_9HYPO|nr:unnamed protein product [Clonostachys chloroleuca]